MGEPWTWKGYAGGRRVQVTMGDREAEVRPLDGRPLDLWEEKEGWRAALRAAVGELRSVGDAPHG